MSSGREPGSPCSGIRRVRERPALDARNASTLQNVYDADDLDVRLTPGSAAVDQGMVVPTVTDGFTGSAPDLGALEVGGAAPGILATDF